MLKADVQPIVRKNCIISLSSVRKWNVPDSPRRGLPGFDVYNLRSRSCRTENG